MSGNDFWTSGTGTGNGKFHSHFSGTGIQVENSNPIFGNGNDKESKWKIPFPFSGTGMRVKNSIPDFRDGNWRPVFPGIPGIGNSRSWLLKMDYGMLSSPYFVTPVSRNDEGFLEIIPSSRLWFQVSWHYLKS